MYVTAFKICPLVLMRVSALFANCIGGGTHTKSISSRAARRFNFHTWGAVLTMDLFLYELPKSDLR